MATLTLNHPTLRRPVRRHGRLALTLTGAVLLHAALLLGLEFRMPATEPAPPTPLEIRLAGVAQWETPGDADTAPAEPVEEPLPEEAPVPEPEPAARPAPPPKPPTAPAPEPAPAEPAPPPPAPKPPVVTAEKAPEPVRTPPPEPKAPPKPTADQLMQNAFALAREPAVADTPPPAAGLREKVVSENTTETEYAFYVRAWRRKVERVGNLNYPAEIRRRNLSGHLILDVALNADGSLRGVQVLRSSGHATLDEAALRIVRLAAPYAPFPDGIRAETDVLHIVRTWRFLDNHRWQGAR